ncbi:hypothetical protein Fcan01_27484 [Folsomia candida]|uniref:Single domain-containing protein n=1 Tax=Folsomia candida TaxID=158441 RepID=A0A226CXP3_FOLCA|nr:hypothetical protein Fcan01_27484 [Folsomia candida]
MQYFGVCAIAVLLALITMPKPTVGADARKLQKGEIKGDLNKAKCLFYGSQATMKCGKAQSLVCTPPTTKTEFEFGEATCKLPDVPSADIFEACCAKQRPWFGGRK